MQRRPFTEKNIFFANMPFNSEGLKTDVNVAHFSTFGLTQDYWESEMEIPNVQQNMTSFITL